MPDVIWKSHSRDIVKHSKCQATLTKRKLYAVRSILYVIDTLTDAHIVYLTQRYS